MGWLTITIFLPLVGIPVLLAGRDLSDRAARVVALIVSAATFAASLFVLADFDRSFAGLQLVERATWVESAGLQYAVGIDGVSVWLVLLTTFVMPIAIAVSTTVTRSVRLYMASMLLLETAIVGAFSALDLLLFFVFFEALLVPMYLLIGVWGSKRRVYAAVKFFLFTAFGSAFLLLAIFVLYAQANDQLGSGTFDLAALQNLELPTATARWLFAAFFVAFAVKTPLFPLHTWLPDAHTEAPTAGSIILAALLLKTGAYGLIRFNLALFPEASTYFATAASILAVIGILYGAVVAMMQTDLKRLIAYSSVSHLGFVVLGIFAFTDQGMSGSVLQMVNHGLSTGALFLIVGLVYERTHTREIAEMGGLAHAMPMLAFVFAVSMLSSIGLPGLNNFVGEWLVILGTFSVHRVFGTLAVIGVLLAATYMLWAYQRAWQGAERERWRGLSDLTRTEGAIVAPMLVLMLAIGLFPKPVLDRIDPSTQRVVQRVRGIERVIEADGAALQAAGEDSAP